MLDEEPIPRPWQIDYESYCEEARTGQINVADLCDACRSRPCLPDCRHEDWPLLPKEERADSPLVVSPTWPGITISEEDKT